MTKSTNKQPRLVNMDPLKQKHRYIDNSLEGELCKYRRFCFVITENKHYERFFFFVGNGGDHMNETSLYLKRNK